MFACQRNGSRNSMARCELPLKLQLKFQCERTVSFGGKDSVLVTLISQVITGKSTTDLFLMHEFQSTDKKIQQKYQIFTHLMNFWLKIFRNFHEIFMGSKKVHQ